MLKRNAWFLVLCMLAIYNMGVGQDIPTFSYFMNNRILYNPGAVGTNETQFTAAVASRFQWTGLEGAPITNLLWADYKFVPQNMAVAMSVYQDRVGAYTNTTYQGYYAYQVYITKRIKLSMGLSAGAGTVSFGSDQIKYINPSDPVYQSALNSNTVPKFGTGLQLYSKKFYVSLSAPDIVTLGDAYKYIAPENFFKKKRNYVAMGGYAFKINDRYGINTNILLIYHPLTGFQANFNAQLALFDYFWLGATYSTNGPQTLMAGTHISSRMKFGYAFGFMPNNASPISLISHEINLILMLDQLFVKNHN